MTRGPLRSHTQHLTAGTKQGWTRTKGWGRCLESGASRTVVVRSASSVSSHDWRSPKHQSNLRCTCSVGAIAKRAAGKVAPS
eukprot:6186412-Pleurochrysis_carterae.AAC.1